MDATENITSPKLFLQWGAISAIACVLERKVWVHTRERNLYPNLYTMLVARPGVGKTETTSLIYSLLEKVLGEDYLAPTSVTTASLIDSLEDAERRHTDLTRVPPISTYNALAVVVDEAGVFLPEYVNEFMATLTTLYDGKRYVQRRRGNKLFIDIAKPHLNILMGGTPSYLTTTMPEGAWEQGFLSRTLLIYSGERTPTSLFTKTKFDITDLQDQLEHISSLRGEIRFTPEAAKFIDAWQLDGCKPVPTQPKLTNYNTRRIVQCLKLSMIACVSESDKLVIEVHHIQRALDWLIEAEATIPEIFKAMSSGGDGAIIADTWHYVYTEYIKNNKTPVGAAKVYHFLNARTPAHNVGRIIEVMEKSNLLKKSLTKTGDAFTPGMKE